jgi:DNA primase
MNSPETPLYSKGQVLFNLDKAKAPMRSMEFALLVEGQMDCISVFMRGIQNVIATSGTAFTEQQVALLRRQTSNVVVNFDPDAAGANAAEKSITLLTEEGFAIKVVTLDGGLDPDRFIRERGVEAYVAAIRGARRQSDYLIERARQQFPGASSDQKVKAMNFLLPHIRRIPEKLERDQAAQKRRDRVEIRASGITEVERVLLRALASGGAVWQAAATAILQHPEWFAHLAGFSALTSLAATSSPDPINALSDPEQRALLAQALMGETDPPEVSSVGDAIHGLRLRQLEHDQREVRALIGEAERRGDWAEVAVLSQRKLALDRELRQLHQ